MKPRRRVTLRLIVSCIMVHSMLLGMAHGAIVFDPANFTASHDAGIQSIAGASSPKDGKNITRDNLTGLLWLDVNILAGFSEAEVDALIEPGGALEDWELATRLEIEKWLCHWDVVVDQGGSTEQTVQLDRLMLDPPGDNWGYNKLVDFGGPLPEYVDIRARYDGGLLTIVNNRSINDPVGLVDGETSPSNSWLLVERSALSAVPEPSGFVLWGLGFMVAMVVWRRGKSYKSDVAF